jgi:very-short-patch-repair endonuclease
MVKKAPSAGAGARARTLRREMTQAEKHLWQILRSRQTEGYRFRRQVPIGGFIADFVCHQARLIVEIDGGQHDPLSEAEGSRTRYGRGQVRLAGYTPKDSLSRRRYSSAPADPRSGGLEA